jgi:ATP-dependent helicase HepA
MKSTTRLSMPAAQFAVGRKVLVRCDEAADVGEVATPPDRHKQVEVRFYHAPQRFAMRRVREVDLTLMGTGLTGRPCFIPRPGGYYCLGLVIEADREASTSAQQFRIRLADGSTLTLTENQFHIRTPAPPGDSHVLAEALLQSLATGPPFAADARREYLSAYLGGVAACRGLTGLLSARIRLLPHQVEVVRRVTQDPEIRYLLGDEVGLGKTIEAGVIIRQLRLASKCGVVVFAPPSLVGQWHRELRDRLGLIRDDDPEMSAVAVWPHERLLKTYLRDDFPLHLVVIDEAHQVVAPAGASPQQRQLAEAARRIARRTRHLLLLSATPIREHEDELLQLLHLLDPERFDVRDVEGFRRRLATREGIGRQLLALSSAQSPRNIDARAQQITSLLPADAKVARLAAQIRMAVGADTNAVRRVGRELRTHLTEHYRIHRRMLRTRRRFLREFAALGGWHLPRRLSREPACEIDPRIPELWGMIEEWRIQVAAKVQRRPAAERESAARNYFRLARQVVSHRGQIPALMREYLANSRIPANERRLLEQFAAVAAGRGRTRAHGFLDLLGRLRTDGGKYVVFCVESSACTELAAGLRQLGVDDLVVAHQGLDRDSVAAAVQKFREDPRCRFLMADSVLEEGHNLQHARGVVCADFPYRPMRVEQQMGRLDRLGRVDDVPCHPFLTHNDPGLAVDAAWFHVLRDGFGLFEESIADVQQLLQQEVGRLREFALFHGPARLAAEAAAVRRHIDRERAAIDDQDVIDGLDLASPDVSSEWRELMAAEDAGAVRRLTAGLACVWRALQGRVSGSSILRLEAGPALPAALAGFVPCSVTVDRTTALDTSEAGFFRPGHELADEIVRELDREVHGRVFAVWRREPGRTAPRVVFRALVRTGPDAERVTRSPGWVGLDLVGQAAIRQLLLSWLPPGINDVCFEEDRPAERAVAELCRPAFDPAADRDLEGDRSAVIAQVFPTGIWPRVVTEVADLARQFVRSASGFTHRVQAATEAADEYLRSVRGRTGSEDPPGIGLLMAARQAVAEPTVRLDSLGVYLLSDAPPAEGVP